MRTDVNELMVAAQDLLEKGLQKCLDLTRALIDNLKRRAADEVGNRLLTNAELQDELTGRSRELYKIMAQTLFELIQKLQPEDCPPEKAINFYFWPGYHSVLIQQRIFIRQYEEDDEWNFGVGICGTPKGKLDIYHDSCQARLFQYLIKPRNESDIAPVDIHRFLLNRDLSRDNPHLHRFLVVTNKPLPRGATPDTYVPLSSMEQGTEGWGFQLDTSMWKAMRLATFRGQHSTRIEDQQFRREAQNKLQSLWLHSAFCNLEPGWLPSFIDTLGAHPGSDLLHSSLTRALRDKRASDWGDKSEGRPLFSSWGILSLSPWLDPRDILLGEDGQSFDRARSLSSKTVGSAAFLSSVPLGPVYLAFAKQWVSEVYNAIRNAEMAMLIHNKQRRVDEAFAAGPYFAHEIQTVVDQALPTVQRAFADDREEAVKTRRFVLYSIRTLCALAYSFTNVVMSPSKDAIERERGNLLDPLRKLRARKVLLSDLTTIAEETYESLKIKDGGVVLFPEPQSTEISADEVQYGACFLLIAELLRNYCHSHRSGPTASFRTWLDGDILTVELEGSTRAERKPTSMSVARLDRFLRLLGVGYTTSEWNWEQRSFRTAVHVNLGIDSGTDHQFS